MKEIGISEAKTILSEICDEVSRSGTPVVLTRRGTPLVRIEAIPKTSKGISELRAEYFAKHPEDKIGEEPEFEIPERSREILDPINFND